MLREDSVILASGSPRRRELLKQIGLTFEVVVSEVDETVLSESTPWQTVETLSERKASSVWNELSEKKIVIGADTVVALDGRILGKPGTKAEAVEMLKALRGREHTVYTGVTIVWSDGGKRIFHEATQVTVSPISDREIQEYVDSGEPMDKAGAYGIQGAFAKYITALSGDYNNVVGLPVGRLYLELGRLWRKNAPKKAAVFDLDGTLSDSIASMTYSGNLCLKELGLQTFQEQDYKYFVGDGAANLVKRMLTAAGDETLSRYEQAYARYKEIFAAHCMDGVKPYEGIRELLACLKDRGLRLAVLSNKPHAESIRVVESLFGKDVFDVIQGQEEGLAIKPSADGVYRILHRLKEEFGVEASPENLLYLGDTGTDMRTGRSAGAYTVGVLWGFRTKQELLEHGADLLIQTPDELTGFLKK